MKRGFDDDKWEFDCPKYYDFLAENPRQPDDSWFCVRNISGPSFPELTAAPIRKKRLFKTSKDKTVIKNIPKNDHESVFDRLSRTNTISSSNKVSSYLKNWQHAVDSQKTKSKPRPYIEQTLIDQHPSPSLDDPTPYNNRQLLGDDDDNDSLLSMENFKLEMARAAEANSEQHILPNEAYNHASVESFENLERLAPTYIEQSPLRQTEIFNNSDDCESPLRQERLRNLASRKAENGESVNSSPFNFSMSSHISENHVMASENYVSKKQTDTNQSTSIPHLSAIPHTRTKPNYTIKQMKRDLRYFKREIRDIKRRLEPRTKLRVVLPNPKILAKCDEDAQKAWEVLKASRSKFGYYNK